MGTRIARRLAAKLLSIAITVAALSGNAAAQSDGPVTKRPPAEPVPAVEVPIPAPAARTATEPAEAAAVAKPSLRVEGATDGVFAPFIVRDGREITEPLTGEPGDPLKGRHLYHNFSRTGCSLCHGTAERPRRDGDERVGPDLHDVASRLSPGRIRLWIVAPETVRPGTRMPAFHKPGQRDNPLDPLFGGPKLTAAEIEDIVAYLAGDAPVVMPDGIVTPLPGVGVFNNAPKG